MFACGSVRAKVKELEEALEKLKTQMDEVDASKRSD